MAFTFERGSVDNPRGHALIYFQSSHDAGELLATYLVVLPIQVNEGGEYLVLAATEIRGPNTKLVLSGGAHPYGETTVASGEFRRLCCGVHVFLNPGQHTFKIQYSALPRLSRPTRESPLRRIVRMRRRGPSMAEIRNTHVFAIWLDDMLKNHPDQTARLISWIPDRPN